ncbi:MAG: ribosome rescue GTPase HflX [Porticoccaceae bacterium]
MTTSLQEIAETAVLVSIELGNGGESGGWQEFTELVRAAGGMPAAALTGRRSSPHAGTFIGSGKVAELREMVISTGATIAIFDHSLSPSQERNLAREIECRVIDRTGLILDIFARRARTHEGKLQVELAQLRHLMPRLVGRATHLARQQGGIGLRGPGETQLETDRRLVRGRITSIERKLALVQKRRGQGRAARRRGETPTVALAGYTNAGKSTLFNTLTAAGALAADQLFATLDPTLRRCSVPGIGNALLADTVGFISRLPHQLVAAFRATLEEVVAADLVLHVIDAANPAWPHQVRCVNEVLEEIGAADVPVLCVFNKIDALEASQPHVDRDASGTPTAAWLSAHTGAGIPLLLTALSERLADDLVRQSYHLAPAHGRLRALLYKAGAIIAESPAEDGGTIVDLCMPAAKLQRLLRGEGLAANPNASSPTQTGAVGLRPEEPLCAHGDSTSWS